MKPFDPRLMRYARATRTFLAVTVGLGAAVAGLAIAQATLLADVLSRAFLCSVRSCSGGQRWHGARTSWRIGRRQR